MCVTKLVRSDFALAIPIVMMERCLVTEAKPDVIVAMCGNKLARSGFEVAIPFVAMLPCYRSNS
jgi:hypothetical protein